MGNGMNKILPGLYMGNIQDSQDRNELKKHNITHILSVHEQPAPVYDHITYLCIDAADAPSQDLRPHFRPAVDFIHKARIDGGNVLVHCMAGISRSSTLTLAYMMTSTELDFPTALVALRAARSVVCPNSGFRQQLEHYQETLLKAERQRLRELHAETEAISARDMKEAVLLVKNSADGDDKRRGPPYL